MTQPPSGRRPGSSGSGPIVSVRNLELQLRASGLPSTFVRAAYFVENWGAVVHPVKSDGVLPSFIAADRRIPQVCTADIGQAAAQALLDGARGVRVTELAGPSEVSPNDVAETFSRALAKGTVRTDFAGAEEICRIGIEQIGLVVL